MLCLCASPGEVAGLSRVRVPQLCYDTYMTSGLYHTSTLISADCNTCALLVIRVIFQTAVRFEAILQKIQQWVRIAFCCI